MRDHRREIKLTIGLTITVNGPDAEVTAITVDGEPAPGPMVAAPEGGAIPPYVTAMLERNTPPTVRPLYGEFLERCANELRAQLSPPASGDRPYVNVFPSPPHRHVRLGALNLKSGRVHCELDPSLASLWEYAEVVENSGTPVHLRIYLRSPDHVAQALDMMREVLAQRPG